MKDNKQKEKNKKSFLHNNFYALNLLNKISKERVIHIALMKVMRYFEWLFFSIFFLKIIVKCLEENKPYGELVRIIICCCIIFTMVELYKSYVASFVIPKTDAVIYHKLYDMLYRKSKNVELECYENPDFYSKYIIAINGASNRIIDAVTSLFDIIFSVIASGIAFYVIVSMDIFSGIFLLFPIVANFFIGKFVNRTYYEREVKNVKNKREADYVNRVMYLSDYAKEIRYSNIYHVMMKKFDASIHRTVDVMKELGKKGTFYMAVKNILTFPVPFEGIMIYAAYRTIVSKTLQLSDLAIIYSTMAATSWMLIGLVNSINASMKSELNIQFIRDFVEYKEKIPEDQDGIIPKKEIETIEFRKVSFGYQSDQMMIKDLSFKINQNECIALAGHNGAGKTTIIKLLLRLYDPLQGEILVNGVNIKKYNLKAYRDLFGVAFQDYKILAMSLKDNIMMGKNIETQTIESAVKDAGFMEKVNTFSNGMDTILTKEFDQQGAVLSGGEVQKIIVARAMAKECSVRIFDEPSSALDPIAEYNLYQSIMNHKNHGIMIFISHRLSSVKDADRVFMMNQGSLIEQGKHTELMKKKGLYSEMFQMQANNYLATEV